jgi:hypothetical protein
VSTLAVASTLFFLFFADLDSTAGADMANSGSDEDGVVGCGEEFVAGTRQYDARVITIGIVGIERIGSGTGLLM